MNTLRSKSHLSVSGFTFPDLLVGAAVCGVLTAGMFTTISAMRRTSAASNHHANSQIQQARLLDYMARDLRRALSVTVDQYKGSERLNLSVPDYYDPSGGPREPVIDGGGVLYGSTDGVKISYFKEDDKVYRSVNGSATPLAHDLARFEIDFTDGGKQAVTVAISFVPRFQFNQDNTSTREATTAFATTLLRNKRQ